MKKIFVAIVAIALTLSLMSCDLQIKSLLVELGLIDATESPDNGSDDDIIDDGNTDDGTDNEDNSGSTDDGSSDNNDTGNDDNGSTGNGGTDGDDNNGGTDNGGADDTNKDDEVQLDTIFVNAKVYGSNEAINLVFTTVEGYAYSVYYKPTGADDDAYVRLEDDLVVRDGDTLTCYIVGISSGEYQIKLEAQNDTMSSPKRSSSLEKATVSSTSLRITLLASASIVV